MTPASRNTIISLTTLLISATVVVGGLAVWMNWTYSQRVNGDWCLRFSRNQPPEEKFGAACDTP